MKEGSFAVSPPDTSPPFLLNVNGQDHPIPQARLTEPLLATLRHLGYTSCKEGCGEGECGACAVVLRAPSAQGSPFTPLNACLTLTGSVMGYDLLTAEALQHHPVQQAMVEKNGSQCGYCTPGFVMSMFAEHYRARPFDLEAISGNLCRCTGYRAIRDAALSLPPHTQDAWSGLTMGEPMPLDVSTFSRPTSLQDAVAWLQAHPEARVLAGGTDAIVEHNQRDLRVPAYLDVNLIPEMKVVSPTTGGLRIGAAVTLSELEQHVPDVIKKEWLDRFASRLVRNRATLGGSLVTASPIGDVAPLLLALDARVLLVGPQGERQLPLAEFFTGYRSTALQQGELLVAIDLQRFPSSLRFYKVTKRHHDDISSVALGIDVQLDGGLVSQARIGLGGVAATPVRATEAEERMVGRKPAEALKEALAVLEDSLHPISDHRASAAYRKQVTLKLLQHHFKTMLGVHP